MKTKVLPVAIIALLILGAHMVVTAQVLTGPWSLHHVYWLDPVVFVLSALVIFSVIKVRKKDASKTALTHAFVGFAKLLTIAIVCLILSKQVDAAQKMPLAVHLLGPALLFIGLELVIVSDFLKQDEKKA